MLAMFCYLDFRWGLYEVSNIRLVSDIGMLMITWLDTICMLVSEVVVNKYLSLIQDTASR